MSRAYGAIYLTGASTAQALSTTAAKMSGFSTDGKSSKAEHGNGLIVADAANDKITVKAGHRYAVDFVVSATHNVAGTLGVTVDIRFAGAAVAGGIVTKTLPQTNIDQVVAHAIVEATADGDIEVYLKAASGTPNFTPAEGSLRVVQLD